MTNDKKDSQSPKIDPKIGLKKPPAYPFKIDKWGLMPIPNPLNDIDGGGKKILILGKNVTTKKEGENTVYYGNPVLCWMKKSFYKGNDLREFYCNTRCAMFEAEQVNESDIKVTLHCAAVPFVIEF